MNGSKLLLEEIQTELDDALSFVEDVVGMNDFCANWTKLRKLNIQRQVIEDWLVVRKLQTTPDKILELLDEIWTANTAWLTPFATPRLNLRR